MDQEKENKGDQFGKKKTKYYQRTVKAFRGEKTIKFQQRDQINLEEKNSNILNYRSKERE